MKLILDQKVNLFFTSHALTKGEDAILRGKGPIPEVFPIGYDGIAFIVNRANNDSCMTVNDVKKILSGQIANWKQLNPKNNQGNIEVVFDNKASATLHYVVDSILGGKNIKSANIVAASNSKSVVDYVHKTPQCYRCYWFELVNDHRDSTNTTFNKNITVVGLSKATIAQPGNSWQPYQAYLLDGRYPFVRTFMLLWLILIRPCLGHLQTFVTNPIGQKIIFKAGLLPYRGQINIREVEVKTQ